MNSPSVAMLALTTVGGRVAPDSDLPVVTLEQLVVAFGIFFVISLGMPIVANWITSRMLVAEDKDFGKAVKLFFLTAAAVLGVIVFAVVITLIGNGLNIPNPWVFALIVGVLLVIYVMFAVPMAVYKIGFLRALAFVILSSIFASIGQFTSTGVLKLALHDTGLGTALDIITTSDPAKRNALMEQIAPTLGDTADEGASTSEKDRSAHDLNRLRFLYWSRKFAQQRAQNKAAAGTSQPSSPRNPQHYSEPPPRRVTRP